MAELQERLEKLILRLDLMGMRVEQALADAIHAIKNGDVEAGQDVERRDSAIDREEVEIEQECIRLLALYQPAAIDLRTICTIIKANNDLERIGDLAVNIARKAITFSRQPPMEIPFDLYGMWEKTQAMLRDSLNSLVNVDAHLAADVCGRDDEVDAMKRGIRREVEAMIRQDPESVTSLMTLAAVSRNLERVADHATNIAEDVVYMVDGKIARHGEMDVA